MGPSWLWWLLSGLPLLHCGWGAVPCGCHICGGCCGNLAPKYQRKAEGSPEATVYYWHQASQTEEEPTDREGCSTPRDESDEAPFTWSASRGQWASSFFSNYEARFSTTTDSYICVIFFPWIRSKSLKQQQSKDGWGNDQFGKLDNLDGREIYLLSHYLLLILKDVNISWFILYFEEIKQKFSREIYSWESLYEFAISILHTLEKEEDSKQAAVNLKSLIRWHF